MIGLTDRFVPIFHPSMFDLAKVPQPDGYPGKLVRTIGELMQERQRDFDTVSK
ncbi:MAG: hypothetical protein HQK57_17160 [Deltaproteobacteria bacterium]|nr:hypothetical protein [Deltaproteobacteria bacterium]